MVENESQGPAEPAGGQAKKKTTRLISIGPPGQAGGVGKKKTTRLISVGPGDGDDVRKSTTTRITLIDSEDESQVPTAPAASAVKPATGQRTLPLDQAIPTGVAIPGRTQAPSGKRPVTVRAKAVPTTAAAPAQTKTKTSKIHDTAKIGSEAGEAGKRSPVPSTVEAPPVKQPAPKTIRLKPPTAVMSAIQDGAAAKPPAAPPSAVRTVRLARETSVIDGGAGGEDGKPGKQETRRIFLEDAKAPADTVPGAKPPSQEAAQPKTIKLKKPATMVSVRPAEAGPEPAGQDVVSLASKGETTRIEILQQDDQNVPITQRKTVRLKRTEKGPDAAERPEVGTAQKPGPPLFRPPTPQAPAEDDSIHLAFALISIAALLTLGFLAYVLASQALAPDVSLPMPASWI